MSYYPSPIPSGDPKSPPNFRTPHTRFSLHQPQTPDPKIQKRRMSLVALNSKSTTIEIKEADNHSLDLHSLKKKFLNTIDNIRRTPIEFYEIVLYSVTKELKGFKVETIITIPSIEITHPLMKFQNNSDMFSDRQREQLELKVEEIEREHPNLILEYKLIYRLVKLIGALLIKWNLVDTKGYKYRYKERQRVIRHYNL